jgi:hypothetical protein
MGNDKQPPESSHGPDSEIYDPNLRAAAMIKSSRGYRTLSATLIILLPTLVLPLFIPNAASAAEDKVAICHLPPGNPQNRQTIIVGASAVAAHLKHGDTIGECPSRCQLNSNLCDDGNLCTADACQPDGTCSHKTVSCDDGNICTQDACDPSVGCTYLPVSNQCGMTSCDDGNACTKSDICTNGTCRGTPVAGCCTSGADCADNNPCTEDLCTGNVCYNPPKTCTSSDQCHAAFCDAQGQCGTTPVNCDDSNVCTDDSCDPVAGCVSTHTSNPPEQHEVSCSDGLDNDCDGFVDVADPDCPQQCTCPHCAAASPGPGGACVVQQCDTGWAQCDGDFANGCEVNITSDPLNCGSCGNVCQFPHAAGGCSNRQCTVAACEMGFRDCDGNPLNGCEKQGTTCP